MSSSRDSVLALAFFALDLSFRAPFLKSLRGPFFKINFAFLKLVHPAPSGALITPNRYHRRCWLPLRLRTNRSTVSAVQGTAGVGVGDTKDCVHSGEGNCMRNLVGQVDILALVTHAQVDTSMRAHHLCAGRYTCTRNSCAGRYIHAYPSHTCIHDAFMHAPRIRALLSHALVDLHAVMTHVQADINPHMTRTCTYPPLYMRVCGHNACSTPCYMSIYSVLALVFSIRLVI